MWNLCTIVKSRWSGQLIFMWKSWINVKNWRFHENVKFILENTDMQLLCGQPPFTFQQQYLFQWNVVTVSLVGKCKFCKSSCLEGKEKGLKTEIVSLDSKTLEWVWERKKGRLGADSEKLSWDRICKKKYIDLFLIIIWLKLLMELSRNILISDLVGQRKVWGRADRACFCGIEFATNQSP